MSPFGKPRTLAQRRARHKRIYGTLKNFSKRRRGKRRRR